MFLKHYCFCSLWQFERYPRGSEQHGVAVEFEVKFWLNYKTKSVEEEEVCCCCSMGQQQFEDTKISSRGYPLGLIVCEGLRQSYVLGKPSRTRSR